MKRLTAVIGIAAALVISFADPASASSLASRVTLRCTQAKCSAPSPGNTATLKLQRQLRGYTEITGVCFAFKFGFSNPLNPGEEVDLTDSTDGSGIGFSNISTYDLYERTICPSSNDPFVEHLLAHPTVTVFSALGSERVNQITVTVTGTQVLNGVTVTVTSTQAL